MRLFYSADGSGVSAPAPTGGAAPSPAGASAPAPAGGAAPSKSIKEMFLSRYSAPEAPPLPQLKAGADGKVDHEAYNAAQKSYQEAMSTYQKAQSFHGGLADLLSGPFVHDDISLELEPGDLETIHKINQGSDPRFLLKAALFDRVVKQLRAGAAKPPASQPPAPQPPAPDGGNTIPKKGLQAGNGDNSIAGILQNSFGLSQADLNNDPDKLFNPAQPKR